MGRATFPAAAEPFPEVTPMPHARASLACLLALSAVLAAHVPADPRPEPGLHWNTSVSDAVEKAKATKKPVLWVVMTDSEIACTRMLGKVYTDPAVIAKLDAFVLLPCSTYTHVVPSAPEGE